MPLRRKAVPIGTAGAASTTQQRLRHPQHSRRKWELECSAALDSKSASGACPCAFRDRDAHADPDQEPARAAAHRR